MIKYVDKYIDLLKNIRNFLVRYKISSRLSKKNIRANPENQSLKVYLGKESNISLDLDNWGKDNVWIEIEYFLANKSGKVLDMCCGSGGTIRALQKLKNIDIHGFDISEELIKVGINSGISQNKMLVLDATNTNYQDKEFDFSYSIGSLEHFTIEGIEDFLKETKRITKSISFHQIPIAKDENFEGWLDLDQSYYNMKEDWWLVKFKKYYDNVHIIKSFWNDPISNGRWFVCS